MSQNLHTQIDSFRNELQQKIQNLLIEFSEGHLSRTQFHTVYEHHMKQLAALEQAVLMGEQNPIDEAKSRSSQSTTYIKSSLTAKPLGVVIYNAEDGSVIETLGQFDVEAEAMNPLLEEHSRMMVSPEELGPLVQQVADERWLMIASGRFSMIVTLFKNEPSARQSDHMLMLLHDFEGANHVFFEQHDVDADKLAFPFLSFLMN